MFSLVLEICSAIFRCENIIVSLVNISHPNTTLRERSWLFVSSMKYTGAVWAARSDTMCRGWSYTSGLKLFISSDRMACSQDREAVTVITCWRMILSWQINNILLSQQYFMNGYKTTMITIDFFKMQVKMSENCHPQNNKMKVSFYLMVLLCIFWAHFVPQ